MADKIPQPKWQGVYDVLTPEDHDVLDTNAANYEFRGGLPKEQAEAKAHKEYLRQHALDSSAHHYLGMKAALAANHEIAAKKHGEAFAAAMGHLGYNPLETLPKDVLERTKDIQKSPYQFKPHKGDIFFESKSEVEPPKEENKTLELIEKLKALKLPVSDKTS